VNILGTTRAPTLRATLAVSGGLVALDGAWASVLGWGTADLTGAAFIERVHPDDQDLVIGAIHSTYGSGAPAGFTCRYARRDGSYLRLAWEASPQPGGVELDLLGWAAA
jgi:PAS domain-containing protein